MKPSVLDDLDFAPVDPSKALLNAIREELVDGERLI